MVFHGEKGLELTPLGKAPLKWIFSHGMTTCFWINLEDIKYSSETSIGKIFTFYSPGNGGVQAYIRDMRVYYRVIGAKYNEPRPNETALGELEPKKWNFICFEHEGPQSLQKSKLNFYLNNNKTI